MIIKWFGLDSQAIKDVSLNVMNTIEDLQPLRDQYNCHDELAQYLQPRLIPYFNALKIYNRISKIKIM